MDILYALNWTSWSCMACVRTGYIPSGNEGNAARSAPSKMVYCSGMIRRAASKVIGMIAIVPFKTPVALLGYKSAIGLGWSAEKHVSAESDRLIRAEARTNAATASTFRMTKPMVDAPGARVKEEGRVVLGVEG